MVSRSCASKSISHSTLPCRPTHLFKHLNWIDTLSYWVWKPGGWKDVHREVNETSTSTIVFNPTAAWHISKFLTIQESWRVSDRASPSCSENRDDSDWNKWILKVIFPSSRSLNPDTSARLSGGTLTPTIKYICCQVCNGGVEDQQRSGFFLCTRQWWLEWQREWNWQQQLWWQYNGVTTLWRMMRQTIKDSLMQLLR